MEPRFSLCASQRAAALGRRRLVSAPNEPGIGVDPNEDVLAPYRIA
jgi:L-alanine-DL-glutamate epimerase-like enolase superfamily enzyme